MAGIIYHMDVQKEHRFENRTNSDLQCVRKVLSNFQGIFNGQDFLEIQYESKNVPPKMLIWHHQKKITML